MVQRLCHDLYAMLNDDCCTVKYVIYAEFWWVASSLQYRVADVMRAHY